MSRTLRDGTVLYDNLDERNGGPFLGMKIRMR